MSTLPSKIRWNSYCNLPVHKSSSASFVPFKIIIVYCTQKNESIKFEISTKSLTLRVPDFFQVLSIWEGSTPHLAYFGGRGDSSSGKSSFQQYFYQGHHVSVRKITSANRFCSVKTTHPKVLIRAALRRPRHFCLPQLRFHLKFIILCCVLPYYIVVLYYNMEPKTHDQVQSENHLPTLMKYSIRWT